MRHAAVMQGRQRALLVEASNQETIAPKIAFGASWIGEQLLSKVSSVERREASSCCLTDVGPPEA